MGAIVAHRAANAIRSTATLFSAGAIFVASALAGFPTGLFLLARNAQALDQSDKARLRFAAAAAGFLAGAILAAFIGAVFLVYYPFDFALVCVIFVPLNFLLAALFARLAHTDEVRAQAEGAAIIRRSAWAAIGIGGLAYLAIFLIGIIAAVIRIAVARAS